MESRNASTIFSGAASGQSGGKKRRRRRRQNSHRSEASGESVTQALLRLSTRFRGDNFESLPGGQGGGVLYQFLVVDFIFGALSVLGLHPHLGDGVHLHSGH